MNKIFAFVVMAVVIVCNVVSAAALNFSTVADSATASINSALSGTAPAIIAICGVIAGVGVVIHLLRKAAR